MNIIRTVGDLKKALSAYSDNLPIKINGPDRPLQLNNRNQLCQINDSGKEYFEIRLQPKSPVRKFCMYCDLDGMVETDNNGPITTCPICNGKKYYTV